VYKRQLLGFQRSQNQPAEYRVHLWKLPWF
jgi:hypothetical protein